MELGPEEASYPVEPCLGEACPEVPCPEVACPEEAFDRIVEEAGPVEAYPEVASNRTVAAGPIPEVAFDHTAVELAIVVAAACHIQQPETVREACRRPKAVEVVGVPGCASCSAAA